MKKTINFSDFVDSFSDTYKNNFSYEGKQALFDYLENYEEETGETIELDPIALCCEYQEFENMDELKASYPDIKDMDDLRDNTQVIEIEGTDKFIIQEF
jgi:mRNA-degrading endonuclease HigB of HigAB toxin-antitoxin module